MPPEEIEAPRRVLEKKIEDAVASSSTKKSFWFMPIICNWYNLKAYFTPFNLKLISLICIFLPFKLLLLPLCPFKRIIELSKFISITRWRNIFGFSSNG